MSGYKDISYNSTKQSVLVKEKSAPQDNIQGSAQQKCIPEDGVGTLTLDKGQQAVREKMVFPRENCSVLNNTYFEFCCKPNNSQLETARKPQKLYKGNNTSHTGEGKQATPVQNIKNQPDSFKESVPIGTENPSVNASKESIKLVEKNQKDYTQKYIEDYMGSKKRKHEDGEIEIPMSDECVASRKNIRFKTEKQWFTGNPFFEFIMKSENSNSRLYVNENSKELYTNNIVLGGDRNMGEKDKICDKNGEDIFGNRLTDKDRNKIKVVCPHCTRKVSAPGFTRHLSYCMRGSMRKSARRS